MAKQETETDPGTTGSAAVHRALAILKCFGGEQSQLRLSDISHLTGFSISTTHRILGALCTDGFLIQNHATEKYEIGPELIKLGNRGLRVENSKVVQEVLEELSNATGESAAVAVRIGDEAIVLECVSSPQRLRFDHELGSRLALHASAMGKALLAFSSGDLMRQVHDLGPLVSYTSHTLSSPKLLIKDLELIRARGWSANDGERYEGVAGVAFPIFGHSEELVGSVGIQGPSLRLDIEDSVRLVGDAAKKLKGRIEVVHRLNL